MIWRILPVGWRVCGVNIGGILRVSERQSKGGNMKLKLLATCLLLASSASLAAQNTTARDRFIREIRHELVMLPYYGVFDNLSYRVDGNVVTLMGQVTRPTLKSSAERVVKDIEGV